MEALGDLAVEMDHVFANARRAEPDRTGNDVACGAAAGHRRAAGRVGGPKQDNDFRIARLDLAEIAIAQRYVIDAMPGWMIRVLLSEPALRLQAWTVDRFPKAGIEAMLRAESTFDKPERKRIATEVANSPEKLRRLREISVGGSLIKDRTVGFNNDIARFAAIEQLPLEEIRCPALICHGAADGDVPFADAETAHRLIPNARLHRLEKGWHLLWISDGGDEMIRIQRELLAAHDPTS